MVDSRVPGAAARRYIKYRCPLCGYASMSDRDGEHACPHHNVAMVPDTTSTDERMSDIAADRGAR